MPANNPPGIFPSSVSRDSLPYRPYFFSKAVMVLLATALVMLWLGEYTNIDLLLADLFYDPNLQAFPWRHNWFAAVFVHQWMKYCLEVPGLLLFGMLLVDAARPVFGISSFTRLRLRMVALSALPIPLVITLMKHFSVMECPWDLERYGGSSSYLRLLEDIPPGWEAGHCFPAGYASTGLWLASIAIFWLPHAPAKAWRVFIAGLGLGVFLGLVQQARGAHFLTHTLWSVWIANALLLVIYAFFTWRMRQLR